MPKITDNTNSKTVIRKVFDENVLWPAMVAATRDAIENGTPQEHALHVLVQYLRGMNQGVAVAALRDMAQKAISDTESDDSTDGDTTQQESDSAPVEAPKRRRAA